MSCCFRPSINRYARDLRNPRDGVEVERERLTLRISLVRLLRPFDQPRGLMVPLEELGSMPVPEAPDAHGTWTVQPLR